MSREEIDQEIAAAWTWSAARHGVENPSGEAFCKTIEECDTESSDTVRAVHALALGILEQGIEWLACLHVSLQFAKEAGDVPPSDQAPIAFIGAAAAYATAVRRLVISGLDSPARSVARSLIEGLRYALVTLHDPELRRGVQASQDLEQANEFWYQHLRPARIEKALDRAEAAVGLDIEARAELRAARKEESLWLGNFAHLSYVSAFVTTMTPTATDPELLKPALIGLASSASAATLSTTNRAIWYFSRFGYALIQRPPAYARLMHNPDTDTLVHVGCDALNRLVLSHWNDDAGDETRTSDAHSPSEET